jgi:LAS superfamily LD-carboxypeptidase LdcB
MGAQIAGYKNKCAQAGLTPSTGPFPMLNPLARKCPGAAAPGFSNHQMGLAIDMKCNGSLIGGAVGVKLAPGQNICFDRLVKNGPYHGFIGLSQDTVGYEAWHWSVNGN